jgi:AcrR family transcriptional regulator
MKADISKPIEINRRDRRRQEVSERIKRSALEVFLKHGFDGAKMTEIAERADVAARTLFNYVTDKHDLLAFVMSDEIAAVSEDLFSKKTWNVPITELVTAELGKCLEVFLRYFPISLLIFRESIWSNTSKEMKRILAGREHILRQLTKMIAYKQSIGAISGDCKPDDVSWILYAIFIPNMRRWMIASRPSLQSELRTLRRQVRIVVNGLSPVPEEASP